MKWFWFFLCSHLLPLQGFCLEKLNSDYLISFGNPDAPIKVIQYFSFTCPHCLGLFKRDFHQIKEKYLEENAISCVFHPVPMDLLTVQAMDCLEKLSEKEKRIFLTALLEVIPIDDSATAVLFMQKAMEIFNKPLPDLQDKDYLSKTRAFKEAFLFLRQEDKINAVPTVEINGQFFPREIPSQEFIESRIDLLLKQTMEAGSQV
jgi:Thioredoxin